MGEIVCFPQRRNIGRARHVAELLNRRRSRSAQETYWTTAATALWRSMLRAGISEDEADRQLDDFADLVRMELNRLDGLTNTARGPGAA